MSFEDLEVDLLAAFNARFGLSEPNAAEPDAPPDTRVLSSCEQIYNNAIDVSISMQGTKAAARSIYALMKERAYSTDNWNAHELHPSPKQLGSLEECVNFIFVMDLLNFSFWSTEAERFVVEYKGKQWTGYYSLVAALQRALDEGVPITNSDFWQNEEECTDEVLQHVFRSSNGNPIPLFEQRVQCLRKAGQILYEMYECSPLNVLRRARSSARRLVHLLTTDFASVFADTAMFPEDSKDRADRVRFHKRAQILAADLWACFKDSSEPNLNVQAPNDALTATAGDDHTQENGIDSKPIDNFQEDPDLVEEIKDLTDFDDINHLTCFADYRVPQMLNLLGVLEYSPALSGKLARCEVLENGSTLEVEIRGCTVQGVEMLRRQIVELQRKDCEAAESTGGQLAAPTINAVLIDFLLYDLAKEMERNGELDPASVLPHHRTRSIWY